MTTSGNLKETSEFYRWALEQDFFTAQEVQRWCGQVVSTQPRPPQALVDAAQGHPEKEVLAGLLSHVPGPSDPALVAREGFAALYRVLDATPHELRKVLRMLRQELFTRVPLDEQTLTELASLQKQWRRIGKNAYAEDVTEAAKDELRANVLSFLQLAGQDNLAGYSRLETQWPRRKKTRLFYLLVILGVMSTAVLVPLGLAMPFWQFVAILVVLVAEICWIHRMSK